MHALLAQLAAEANEKRASPLGLKPRGLRRVPHGQLTA